jgi:hypothetical protein
MKTTIRSEEREEFNRKGRKVDAKGAKFFPCFFSSRSSQPSLGVLCGFFFLLLAFCFTGCPVEPEDEGGGTVISVNLPINTAASGERRYYDLSAGKEVSNPSDGNWDIALESSYGAFFVLTNSGVTAAETSSSGLGGVWFTNSTDFGAITSASQRVVPEAGSEYAPYTADVYRWTMVMGAEPVRQSLNVTSYLGYPGTDIGYPKTGSGDGSTSANCFRRVDVSEMSASYSPYLFNKRQSYTMGGGMPPEYAPTNQVYIVRHGDGVKYSKVQLSEIYREPGIGSFPSLFVVELRHETVE